MPVARWWASASACVAVSASLSTTTWPQAPEDRAATSPARSTSPQPKSTENDTRPVRGSTGAGATTAVDAGRAPAARRSRTAVASASARTSARPPGSPTGVRTARTERCSVRPPRSVPTTSTWPMRNRTTSTPVADPSISTRSVGRPRRGAPPCSAGAGAGRTRPSSRSSWSSDVTAPGTRPVAADSSARLARPTRSRCAVTAARLCARTSSLRAGPRPRSTADRGTATRRTGGPPSSGAVSARSRARGRSGWPSRCRGRPSSPTRRRGCPPASTAARR